MAPVFIKRYGGRKEGLELQPGDELYSIIIDNDEEDPENKVTYGDMCEGYTPVSYTMGPDGNPLSFDWGSWGNAFFIPQICYLDNEGQVVFLTQRDDVGKKIDGTDSGLLVSTTDHKLHGIYGNVMVRFPKVYYKAYTDLNTNKGYVYIANRKLDKDFVCYANIDADGNEIPYFYFSVFECFRLQINGVYTLKSLYGKSVKTGGIPNGGTAVSYEYAAARANNVGGDNIWFPGLQCDRVVIDYLLLLIGKTTDLQRKFGNGAAWTTSAGVTNKAYGNSGNSFYVTTQSTGIKSLPGLFSKYDDYGNYNMGRSRVFGIENYWGGGKERVWGCCVNGGNSATKARYLVKMTHGTQDGSSIEGFENTVQNGGQGFIDTGIDAFYHNNNYTIKEYYFTNYGMFPKAMRTDGDTSKDYCDSAYIYLNNTLLNKLSPGGLHSSLGSLLKQGGLAADYSTTYPIMFRLSCKPYASRINVNGR